MFVIGVEGEVTVPTGIFRCFKMVFYEENKVTIEKCVSVEVKAPVKKYFPTYPPEIWELGTNSIAK